MVKTPNPDPVAHSAKLEEQACPIRFSPWSREELDFVCDLSSFLRQYRELSFYGDEAKQLSPQTIIKKDMADRALDGLKRAHTLCLRILPSR